MAELDESTPVLAEDFLHLLITGFENEKVRQRVLELMAEQEDLDSDSGDEELTPEEEEAAEWQRFHQQEVAKGQERAARQLEAEKRILDYDPKQGGTYHNRLYHIYNLASFDHDEESPLLPMRYTDAIYKSKDDYKLYEGLNIFSVNIGSLNVDFPIHVYGTVIARDSLDKKCIYLFRRDRDDSQIISSKDESLILTGPKRGIALISNTYIETNLKIKGHPGQEDRELSKGYVAIPGMERRVLRECQLESCSLATRLSTVDVMYGVIKAAVEATIAIELLAGDFCGEITACTSSIKKRMVLHDSRLAGIRGGNFVLAIPLLRSVVAVHVKENLLLTITGDLENAKCIDYTPRVNGSCLDEISVGCAILRVKVVWSIIGF